MLSAMEADLNSIYWGAGMELDMSEPSTNTLTNQQQKSAATDKANTNLNNDTSDPIQSSVAKAQAIGENMLSMINRNHRRIYKMLYNTWTSNDKYIEQYNEMSQTYRLLNNITVINWTYGHDMEQYLHAKVVKMRAILTTNANYLNNWQNIPETAAIQMDKTEMTRALLGEMGAPSSIDDMGEFMGHLRAQFRGRKSEKSYNGAMAQKYIQEVRSFAKTKSSYSQDMQAAERIAKTARDVCMGQLRNANFQDTDRKILLKLLQAVQRMVVFYVNLIGFVYRLEVEYILNRRAIISRLYEK